VSVFIDTSAIVAVLDARDDRNTSASRIWRSLIEAGEEVITSNYVFVETVSVLHSRYGIAAVRGFAETIAQYIRVTWVDPQLHSSAFESILASGSKSEPSFVDRISFELIEKLNVDRVFAYDKHFENAGHPVIS
jgi:uncharacterized protein